MGVYSEMAADLREDVQERTPAVQDAAELAESLHIPNLVLWHTEDKSVGKRKELYMTEGKTYYHGNLYVPEDRDIIAL